MFAKIKKIPKHYIVGFFCLCVLGLLVVFSRSSLLGEQEKIPVFDLHSQQGAEEATIFWKKEITRRGSKSAYTVFLRTYVNLNPGDQHTVAHIFGAALFQVSGVAGLSTCDSSFAYGCFHEFLGRAIEAGGISQVASLNQACYDAVGPVLSLTCTHGLGHGIQSYLGYTEEALVKSLDICKNLPYSDPIGGCPGGVFMEYNLRIMHSFTGMPIREPMKGDLLYPCNTLSHEYAAACYYWQPQWWHQVFLGKVKSTEESFRAIGDLCRKAPIDLQRDCFEGTGIIVAQAADFDALKAVSLCSEAAPKGIAQSTCRSAAAGSFAGVPSVKKEAIQLCDGLEGDELTTCLRFASQGVSRGSSPEERI